MVSRREYRTIDTVSQTLISEVRIARVWHPAASVKLSSSSRARLCNLGIVFVNLALPNARGGGFLMHEGEQGGKHRPDQF